MKINFNEIFLVLATIYFFLVLLASFDLIGQYVLHFELFGVIVGIIGAIAILNKKPERIFVRKKILQKESISTIIQIIFVLAIILILVTRIIPYTTNTIPLGYDPGIYKYAFEAYSSNLPNLPFNELDVWLQQWEPQGFFVLTDLLNIYGFTIDQIMIPFFIFVQFVLGLMIYSITKHFFGKKEAVLAIFLYSISVIEFKVFWYFYLKNVIGLILLLTSFYLYSKKKYFASALVAGFLAGLHRPTFLLFTIIFGLNFLIDFKNVKKNLQTGLLITLICLGFYWGKFDQLLFSTLVPSIESPGAGTFMDFFQYQFSILVYLPFAIIGGIELFKHKEKVILLIGALISLFIVTFQLIFYNRFLIFLEVFVLILAAYGVKLFIESENKQIVKFVIIGLLLVSGIFLITKESIDAKPLISESELSSIKMIDTITETNALILVTNSQYSPWVKGYTTRIVIAPGLFDEDKWNRKEWEYFWMTSDENEIRNMLSDYKKPIYVFISSKSFGNNEKFENNCFEKKLLNSTDLLYKYICD